jgi:protein SCO1
MFFRNVLKPSLLLTVLGLLACSPSTPVFKATDISGVDWGQDFTLMAHTGRTVSTADFRGKAVVVFFGYTHCPDICAPTLSKLALVMQQLGADAAKVQVLFVTVDPAHDTVPQLASFVPKFHPDFIGLTGSRDAVTAVAAGHKIGAQTTSGGKGTVIHSGTMMVRDPSGKLRLSIRNEASVDDIVHDLRLLLKR